MNKKSITPSLRLNEDDYQNLRELKNEYGVSWTQFIAFANTIIERDMEVNGIKKNSKKI